MASRRALVIGGSLGGLLTAHLLRSAGWEVAIFERNGEDLTGRGAGLSTHTELIDILRRVGIDFDESMGTRLDLVVCLDRDGRTCFSAPTARTMSSWGRLYRALRDPLPPGCYRLGKSLTAIEQSSAEVSAVFADGTRASGDLLVAADGSRSTVRELLLPGLALSYAGYVAWRAMLDETEVPASIRGELFTRYIFCLPDGEMCLAYPVPGRNNETQAGRRAYNIVWYRPTAPTMLADMCTDASGRHHGLAIPPPLIRPEVTAGIKSAARNLLAPQVAEIVARTPQPFFQPICDLASPQIVLGRVALVGDAAFVARPHVGAGVTKAALDAESLADAVAQDDLAGGLALHQRRQLTFGAGLVALGRAEGAYLGAQLKPSGERNAAERERAVADVIASHNSRSEKLRAVLREAHRAARPPDIVSGAAEAR